MSAFLADEGYEVRTATTGADALAEAARFHPDVILSDFLLPDDTDGIRLTKTLTAERPALGAAILTGFPPSELGGLSPDFPHIRILQKPLSLDQIIEVVRSLSPPNGPGSEASPGRAD